MNRALLISGVVWSAVGCGSAWALPAIYDSFGYANDGSPLAGKEGGYGWAGPWVEQGGDGDATFQFVTSGSATSLDMPNLPFEPSGGHIVATGPGSGGNNNFISRPTAIEYSLTEETTFYVSYLMQKTGGPGTSGNNMELNLNSTTGATIIRMGSTSGNAFFLGPNSGNTIPGFTVNYGETYFVVLKVEGSADEPDMLSAMVFDATETIPATEPAVYDITATTPSNAIIAAARLGIGINASGLYDELRIGNTWEDVTFANPNYILGDFDQMNGVQPADYNILAANLYTGTTYEQGDINFSGLVDLEDFAIFREIYAAAGFSIGPAATVPEPATWLALVGAAVAAPLWLRRQRTA